MKAHLTTILKFLLTCPVKLFPLLDNIWFGLFLLFMLYDGVDYYAKYFNHALYAKLSEYDPYVETAFYVFLVILLVVTAIFLVRTYKKALSHSVNP